MRHTVHIFVGNAMKNYASSMREFLDKYTIFSEGNYCQVFYTHTVDDNSFSIIQATPEQTEGISEKKIASEEEGADWYTNLYSNTLTINYKDDFPCLYVCIYVPMYDREAWMIAQKMFAYATTSNKQFETDLFGLSDDLSHLIKTENDDISSQERKSNTAKSLNEAVALEKEKKIHRVIFMQNCNEKSISLNLDKKTLSNVLGEYALLVTDRYSSIYLNNDLDIPEVTIFGVSALWFEKQFFVDYLLKKAYIHILERENVDDNQVDANKMDQIVAKVLNPNVDVFGKFYQETLVPLINEDKDNGSSKIAAKANEVLAHTIATLREQLVYFLTDPELSLPEKRVAMAQLLGADDELLDDYLFRNDQKEIEDFFTSAMNLFVNEDNANVIIETDSNGKEIIDSNRLYQAHGGTLTNSNESGGHNILNLDQIHKLKADIKEMTAYIRNKTRDLQDMQEGIKNEETSKRVLTKDGFTYNGVVYKLMDNITPRFLDSTFEPTGKPADMVDLRSKFSPIRDQKEIGSCVSFATTSIFEYLLNRINGQSDTNLSPRFVYYNVSEHDASGEIADLTKGSNYYDNFKTLSTEGVCAEDLCPYNEEVAKRPSDEAYDDGKSRLVVKAQNVEVNHTAITSALTAGYPVAISLRVFDSFGQQNKGFIFLPTEAELNEEDEHYHAMVIVGYLKESPVYIVRNSWGTNFGDKGYCYIPFSYIDNTTLCKQACIVSEINCGTIKQDLPGTKQTASFDVLDKMVAYALLRIEIDEQKQRLKEREQLYNLYKTEYTRLQIELGNPTKRGKITGDSVNRKVQLIQKLEERHARMTGSERTSKLKKMKASNQRKLIRCGICSLVLIVLFVLSFFAPWKDSEFGSWSKWITLALSAIMIVVTVLLIPFLKIQYKRYADLLTEEASQVKIQLAKENKDLVDFKIRMHMAGQVIDELDKMKRDIEKQYATLKSYVSNLSQWLKEVKEEVKSIENTTKDPFMSVLQQQQLDVFLNKKRMKSQKTYGCSSFSKIIL